MPILHRYILRLFIKVLLVSFVSLTGLFVVIDAFNNLEEFLTYSKTQGWMVLVDYYGPRVLTFFDRISGMLGMMATMFAITSMQRSNEMTAVMAGGIPQVRIVKPLIFGVLTVSLLAAGNRELLIPRFRDKLTRNAQDWLGESARSLHPRYDHRTQVLISGKHTFAAERRIEFPKLRLPDRFHEFGRHVTAANAYYEVGQGNRPNGYLLDKVEQPENVASMPALFDGEHPVLLTPQSTAWLKPNQCFLVSDLTFDQLAAGSSWRRFSSSAQLISGLRNPSLDVGAEVRVTVHTRLVKPLLDMTLLFLGLPLVLTRSSRNVFLTAGLSLSVVAAFNLVTISCHAMGGSGYLLSPALAAWFPLLLFVPLASWLSHPLLVQRPSPKSRNQRRGANETDESPPVAPSTSNASS